MHARPLYYTFGNHMHWVDMQWLWGYGVLPGCVDDMLHLIAETGAKGNVNFDGIGYEKMAAECPEALARLRDAVRAGDVEPVGCSYGQPYGLFHGAESNIRQFTYGVRAVLRHLGLRPRTFWEEEFYFYPQLPQILRGCGFTGACLFFQWTWHTPEMPTERCSLVQWEGIDGTRIPTLPRNDLNVHQWPEDFDGLLESDLIRKLDAPAIVQWLELMPTRDWMCRGELILPRLRELMSDERFDIRPRTCAELIAELGADGDSPVRRYTMDDVWHGMTLGKNADRHPRLSRGCERWIQLAESTSALAGLFGRPYASWDVYPSWEIDEAWRELLSAQHHDNHECEGLCGAIGYHSMDRARHLAWEVAQRTIEHLGTRTDCGMIEVSHVGWPTETVVVDADDQVWACTPIPPFGYVSDSRHIRRIEPVEVRQTEAEIAFRRGDLGFTVDPARGMLTMLTSPHHRQGVIAADSPMLQLRFTRDGKRDTLDAAKIKCCDDEGVSIERTAGSGKPLNIHVRYALLEDAIDISLVGLPGLPRPDPGLNASLQLPIVPGFKIDRIIADTPCSVQEVSARSMRRRKYPEGDWMTSPQWFEEVVDPFTSFSFVDLLDADGRGLLIIHDGSQQHFRNEHGIRLVLNAYDPWDERRYETYRGYLHLRLIPHGGLRNSQRIRLARAFGDFINERAYTSTTTGDIPPTFGALSVEGAPNVLAMAFFRESMKAGEHLPDWAGHRLEQESGGACTHPYVIRLIEWDGEAADVALKLPGAIALAAKTNLMGEVGRDVAGGDETGWLAPEPAEPPDWARKAKCGGRAVAWSQLTFTMRPFEIATIMADLVMGRKQWRDLDAKRAVWATIHKKPSAHPATKDKEEETLP